MDSENRISNLINKNIFFKDGNINVKIYETFRLKWFDYRNNNNRDKMDMESVITLWEKFIKFLDLGIICVSYFQGEYMITDEKKWLLSKLKYGI